MLYLMMDFEIGVKRVLHSNSSNIIIIPRSHIHVKPSRKSHERNFRAVEWVVATRGSYGVYVAMTGSTWLLRAYTWRLLEGCSRASCYSMAQIP